MAIAIAASARCRRHRRALLCASVPPDTNRGLGCPWIEQCRQNREPATLEPPTNVNRSIAKIIIDPRFDDSIPSLATISNSMICNEFRVSPADYRAPFWPEIG
jgi:hypothetical protein